VESIQSTSGSRQTGSHSDKPARKSDFCGIAIKGKVWSAIITYRGENVRIISVRRAREEEVELYEII
jgi:uncharacterized DUF497 family protein